MIKMDEPKNRVSNINFDKIASEIFLDGEVPRLIDEWQVAPCFEMLSDMKWTSGVSWVIYLDGFLDSYQSR